MAFYKGASAEGQRAMNLLKKRQQQQDEMEKRKKKLEEETEMRGKNNYSLRPYFFQIRVNIFGLYGPVIFLISR